MGEPTSEYTTDKPRIKKYTVDVMIPPACLDEDGGSCPCEKKPVKQARNPV